jgi:hypothetical protein
LPDLKAVGRAEATHEQAESVVEFKRPMRLAFDRESTREIFK